MRNGTVRAWIPGVLRTALCSIMSNRAGDSIPSAEAVLVLLVPYFARMSPLRVIRSRRRYLTDRLKSAMMNVFRSLGRSAAMATAKSRSVSVYPAMESVRSQFVGIRYFLS